MSAQNHLLFNYQFTKRHYTRSLCILAILHRDTGSLRTEKTSLGYRAAVTPKSMVASTRIRLIWRHFTHNRMGDMSSKTQLPTPETALPGRSESLKVSGRKSLATSVAVCWLRLTTHCSFITGPGNFANISLQTKRGFSVLLTTFQSTVWLAI